MYEKYQQEQLTVSGLGVIVVCCSARNACESGALLGDIEYFIKGYATQFGILHLRGSSVPVTISASHQSKKHHKKA